MNRSGTAHSTSIHAQMVPSETSESVGWNEPRPTVALPNLPLVHSDQVLASIIANTGLHNGFHVGRESTWRILGSPAIKADRTFHAGVQHAYDVLGHAGYESFEQFADNHCFLRLFKPFLTEATYARSIKKLQTDEVTGLAQMLDSTDVTGHRSGYRFCHQCVERSLAKSGYAFAHRTPQVTAVDFCPEHGTVLSVAQGDRSSASLINQGLILASDDADWHDLLTPITPLSESESWRRFGKWVSAVMSGNFPIAPLEARIAVLQQRVMEIPRETGDPSSPAARLERHLIRAFGTQSFDDLGLPIFTGITGHWPAFLLHGTAYTEHPIANLLAIASLFSSLAEYTERIAGVQPHSLPKERNEQSGGARPTRVAFDLSVIRALYREASIPVIAQRMARDPSTVESLLRLHPHLAKRREQFLAWVEKRRKRRIVEECILRNPNAMRITVMEYDKTTYNWLLRYDKEWFSSKLPSTRTPRRVGDLNLDHSLVDARVARRLSDIARNHISSGDLQRISKALLLKQLEPSERKLLASGILKKSEQAICEMLESQRAHLTRLQRLMSLLVRSGEFGRLRQLVRWVFRHYGRQQNYVNMIVDILIAPELIEEHHSAAA